VIKKYGQYRKNMVNQFKKYGQANYQLGSPAYLRGPKQPLLLSEPYCLLVRAISKNQEFDQLTQFKIMEFLLHLKKENFPYSAKKIVL
jgi:hypothetical protein